MIDSDFVSAYSFATTTKGYSVATSTGNLSGSMADSPVREKCLRPDRWPLGHGALAEPLTDANGHFGRPEGGPRRYTTIYDAARKLYVEEIGTRPDRFDSVSSVPHAPGGGCRLCMVQIYSQARPPGGRRKLLPAASIR
jgi:hypothetical protein